MFYSLLILSGCGLTDLKTNKIPHGYEKIAIITSGGFRSSTEHIRFMRNRQLNLCTLEVNSERNLEENGVYFDIDCDGNLDGYAGSQILVEDQIPQNRQEVYTRGVRIVKENLSKR